MYEPSPRNGRKSFGGKCRIIVTADGYHYLQSYNTIVAYIDDKDTEHRLWDDWSLTTGSHLQAIGINSKRKWDSLPVESLPELSPFSNIKL
jgi:hypothetical protein